MPITSKLNAGGGVDATADITWTGAHVFDVPVKLGLQNQFGGWSPARSSGTVGDFGICDAVIVTQAAGASGRDSDGHRFQQNTAASAGSEASLRTATGTSAIELLPQFLFKFKLNQTTDTRLFMGITSSSAVLNADDPAFDCIGLQYSSARADTNFQITTRDTAQSLTDTGVAVDTDAHTIIFTVNSTSSVSVEMLDNTGASEFTGEITTQIPTSTVNLDVHAGIQTLAASTGIVFHYAHYITNRFA